MRKIYAVIMMLWMSILSAQSINLYEPTSGNTYGDSQFFCSGETFSFKVDAIATSTGDYGISKELPSPALTAGSVPINFRPTGSNKFSESFPIGFNFDFYGKTYSRVVLGSNGRLVFTNDPQLDDLNDNTIYIDRTFSGVRGGAPTILASRDYNKVFVSEPVRELDLAQIFLGYTDLVPKSTNPAVEYKYSIITLEGKNALLISFQNQIQTDGVGGISSSRYNSYVILIEGGEILINVNGKTEDNYNAILGIQNDNATKFKVPSHSIVSYSYNNGRWKSEGVAFRFTPNLNLTPEIRWFRNGVEIAGATNDTLTGFVPNDGDVLKIEVTYSDEHGNVVGTVETDEIIFNSFSAPVIRRASASCAEIKLETDSIPGFLYEWYKAGDATVLSTTNSLTARASGSYFVRLIRQVPGFSCYKESAPEILSLNYAFPGFTTAPRMLCKTDGSMSTSVNLYDYYPENPSEYNLVFKENGVVISNPTNFILTTGTPRTITAEVTSVNTTTPCTNIDTAVLSFYSLPEAGTIYTSPKLCSDENSYALSNFESTFGTGYSFTYSTDGGSTFISLSSINPQNYSFVLVKLKHTVSGCESIVQLNFDFHAEVIANTPVTQLPPQCASATQYFDLAPLIPEINNDPSVTVTFHRNLNDAQTGTNPVSLYFRGGLGITVLYIRVINNSTGCVSPNHPTISLEVYRKPNLLISNLSLKNCEGNTIFNLSQNISALTDASASIGAYLEYYSSTGTLLTPAEVASYNESVHGSSPYINIVYNTTCNDVVNFQLTYNPKPRSLVSEIIICEETNYDLEDFKAKAISNPELYTFTAVDGQPLPTDFNLNSLPSKIDFYIRNNSTGCLSNLQSITFVKGDNSILLTTETDYILCDTDFDGKTTFNLGSQKTAYIGSSTAVFEYFLDAALTKTISSNYINEIPFHQTIYIKIREVGLCPVVAKMNLKVNTPSKSTTLQDIYLICFGEEILVDAGAENTSWKWSTGETTRRVKISKPGSYSVILTNSLGCSYTHNFTVSDENQPKIKVINQTANSLEVIAEGGVQPYRYYFNGVSQSSNILMNPTASSYTVQVQSATGCLGPPATVYFIKVYNSFTPNGDGKNEKWKIENLDKMEKVSIQIVDRLGNLVFKSDNPNQVEWDGKLHGKPVPTGIYWYNLLWYDSVIQKNEQRQGWILLKNRN